MNARKLSKAGIPGRRGIDTETIDRNFFSVFTPGFTPDSISAPDIVSAC